MSLKKADKILESRKMNFLYIKFYCEKCKVYHVIVSQIVEVGYTMELITGIFDDKDYNTHEIDILLNRNEAYGKIC